jgi:heme exporter protein CcmD
MDHAGFIVASYSLTLGGIAVYIWRVLRRGRTLSRDVPVEDRPWT